MRFVKNKLKSICIFLFSGILKETRHPKSILVILSDQSELEMLNGEFLRTGFFLNELMIPILALQNAGLALTFATPSGDVAFLDPNSSDLQFFKNEQDFKTAKNAVEQLEITTDASTLSSFDDVIQGGLDKYDGLFIPGGHAPMINLTDNQKLGTILSHFHKTNKPTASICHGPIALLSAQGPDGWAYKGYKMTVFSNDEEQAIAPSLPGPMPYLPQTRLHEAGADIEVNASWTSHVAVDRELITGQNPQSDDEMVKTFIKMLNSD